MIHLKQSTAVTLLIGPFLDDTDGKTAETALTITQAEVRLSKNGGNMAQKGEATSLVHDELGYYTCPLNTTDTNTLGQLKVMVHEAGALPVWEDCMIMPANVWDSMYGADLLQVDATQILGTVISTPATAGILDVNLKNIANAAVSTTAAQLGVNVVQISGDGPAADNCESDYDGTGYAGGTIVKVADVTKISGVTVSTSTAQLGVNVVQVSGDSTSADNLEAFTDGTGYAGGTIKLITDTTSSGSGDVTSIAGSVTAATNCKYMFDGTGYAGGTINLEVDEVKLLGTAISTPATAGILDVNLKNIANAVVSTSTAQLGVNTVEISGDSVAADNLEAFTDGTGYAGGTIKLEVDEVKLLGTAISTPATAGILDVNLKNIANASVSTTTAQLGVNTVEISGDGPAADACEAMFDGTGYAGGTIKLEVNTTNIGTDVISALSVSDAAATKIADANGSLVLSELTVAKPSATPTLNEAIMLLYMALRNETQTTLSELKITNDAGTVICKATLLDDGSIFTKTELGSGA